MSAEFTPEEKVRIRHHLGYPNVGQVQTFAGGVPAAFETTFMIEGAMVKVLTEAMPMARTLLSHLDIIGSQMIDDLELLAINEIGDIKINQEEQAKLKAEYVYKRKELGNLLGVPPNPFDQRFGSSGAGGVNVPVIH